MSNKTIENYRDKMWRREPERLVETVSEAENFIETVGFAYALTDMRWLCPSLYIAVCGRRDASMPKNVQKDPEASHTWLLKDDLVRRGRVYYAKLANGRATFLATRLLPAFYTIWGIPSDQEREKLSLAAISILNVLHKEWDMASSDLRKAAEIADRPSFSKAVDQLQACFKVIPSEVVYAPKFTYIWSLTASRFGAELLQPIAKEAALAQIAKVYLTAVGEAKESDLVRITGLSRADAHLANQYLVAEGYAQQVAADLYRLSSL